VSEEEDEADAEGWIPLLLTCEQGNIEIARLLLEAGADKDGALAYRLACVCGSTSEAPRNSVKLGHGGAHTVASAPAPPQWITWITI
jgi:ankyrin repeat protein